MRIGRNQIPTSWYVNGAAGALAVFLIGFVIRDFFVKDEIPTCSERYTQGSLFSLKSRSGELVSAPELQGRLAGNDLGVLENIEVVGVDHGVQGTAMRVRLAAVDPIAAGDTSKPNGVAFTWLPRRLPPMPSTCLSYDFRLPHEFPMGQGGNLPGLVGGTDAGLDNPTTPTSGFASRPRWTSDGKLVMRIVTEDSTQPLLFGVDTNWLKINPGPWIRLEQEVVLNTPGQADGIVRVWVDGEMKLNQGGIAFRKEKSSFVQGVTVSVGYLGRGEPPKMSNNRDAAIEVSPFEVRWP